MAGSENAERLGKHWAGRNREMDRSAGRQQAGRERAGVSRRGVRLVLTFLAVWLGLPWLFVSLLVAGIVPGGWWMLAGVLLFTLAGVAVRVRGFVGSAYAGALKRRLLVMPSTYVFLMMPLLALSGLAGVILGGPFVGVLTGGRVAVEAGALVLGLLAVAGYFGSRRLVVKPVEVEHEEIAPEFDGLRIAQLSDLHVGPHTSREFLARIAEQVERARPDMIVFTGDLVDDHARDADDFLRAFGHLRAPLGVYAIAGNHDVFAGWSGVAKRLRAAGVHVLVNEGTTLQRNGAALWIGGTGDPAALRFGSLAGKDNELPVPDLDRTMAHAPRTAFRIVLAHNPALWRGLSARGAHLTLSGHTHHGQFSIPALNWSLASPFLEHAMGRYDAGPATLYINPGTNFWGIPMRLGAWPEITLVTLRRSK